MASEWKTVPVEPTEEMMLAMHSGYWGPTMDIHDGSRDLWRKMYRAMLEAAPQPDTTAEPFIVDKDGNASLNLDHPEVKAKIREQMESLKGFEPDTAIRRECDCCGYPGHDLPKWRQVLREAKSDTLEPVAWMYEVINGNAFSSDKGEPVCIGWDEETDEPVYGKVTPLYTHPPAQPDTVAVERDERVEFEAAFSVDEKYRDVIPLELLEFDPRNDCYKGSASDEDLCLWNGRWEGWQKARALLDQEK